MKVNWEKRKECIINTIEKMGYINKNKLVISLYELANYINYFGYTKYFIDKASLKNRNIPIYSSINNWTIRKV